MIVRSGLRGLDEIYLFVGGSPGRRQFFGCGWESQKVTDLSLRVAGSCSAKTWKVRGSIAPLGSG